MAQRARVCLPQTLTSTQLNSWNKHVPEKENELWRYVLWLLYTGTCTSADTNIHIHMHTPQRKKGGEGMGPGHDTKLPVTCSSREIHLRLLSPVINDILWIMALSSELTHSLGQSLHDLPSSGAVCTSSALRASLDPITLTTTLGITLISSTLLKSVLGPPWQWVVFIKDAFFPIYIVDSYKYQ